MYGINDALVKLKSIRLILQSIALLTIIKVQN